MTPDARPAIDERAIVRDMGAKEAQADVEEEQALERYNAKLVRLPCTPTMHRLEPMCLACAGSSARESEARR